MAAGDEDESSEEDDSEDEEWFSDFPFIDDVKKGERYSWETPWAVLLYFVFCVFWVVVCWTCVFMFVDMCLCFFMDMTLLSMTSMVDWHVLHFHVYHLCYFCISLIYACVEGELHLKSPPKIFVITIYVLSSSKRGRLLAQRTLARYFDDNKPYLVMFLTILFKRISGLKQVDLTAPHQDSQFGRR